MGYDCFWPTSLATVNVLCVPACGISPQGFEEVFERLKKITFIDVKGISLDNDASNQLILTSKPQVGSIVFNYSKSTRSPTTDRFPLELNADPQIVFGLYDASHRGSRGQRESEPDRLESELEQTVKDLRSRFENSRNACTATLLTIGVNYDTLRDSVISLKSLDGGSVRSALKLATTRLISNLITLTGRLTDTPLGNPQQSPALANGSTPRPSHETSPSTLQEESPKPSGDVIQTTDQQKGRYTIIVGLLNLYVGSWQDAMRRLSEGAVSAHESGDLLWQARAIEGLLVCMTLQAWQGVDFIIPELFDPSRAYNAIQQSQRSRAHSITTRLAVVIQAADKKKLTPFERWLQLAPFVANLALDLYSLVSPSRVVPQIICTESRIRLINTLVFCQVHGKSRESLESFILNGRHPPIPIISRSPVSSGGSAATLASMLFDLTISLETSIDIVSQVEVLTAVISSLSSLGTNRKYAFLLRTLLLKLAPAMIKARKIGASEAGIHPAAALAATSGNTTSSPGDNEGDSLKSLLESAAMVFGISLPRHVPLTTVLIKSADQMHANLEGWYEQYNTGDFALKLEILQLCVNVSDALPDIRASLLFVTALLRLAIREHTMSTRAVNSKPWLPPEDQIHYVDSAKKTAAAAQRLGQINVKAAYWDDLLVRDIQFFHPPTAAHLTSHSPNELSVVNNAASDGPTDPFIFNPFAGTGSGNTTPIVVASELISFSILLQNPLEVEVDIVDISLWTEGCEFEASHHSIVLGSFCAQTFSLTGRARESGTLTVIGCRATVEGCYPQEFPIYRDEWKSPIRVKLKPKRHSGTADDPIPSDLKIPQASTLSLKVIDSQPHVDVEALDLTQPSLMLLEGEKKTFQLAITNASTAVPADLFLFTYHDNVTSSLQHTLQRKDLSAADTYEIQYQLKHRSILRMSTATGDAGEEAIPPQQVIKRSFDLFSRPGLLNAAVQVDFAYLGVPRAEIKDTFHTRQARFPLSVTVNGSIEIVRCNTLPVGDDFFLSTSNTTTTDLPALLDGYCMLSLDLRNVWPHPLNVELTSNLSLENSTDPSNLYTFTATIQPGHTSRCILLVPRLFIADPYAPIPNLVTARQFVVSASKLSVEAEAASREMFWYREALLQHLSGTWKEEKTARHGEIDMRKGVRLTVRMVDVLKVEHVDVEFHVVPDSDTRPTSIERLGRSHFKVPVEAFATLVIKVRNRSTEALLVLLRLQPSLRDQPHNIALDLSRRFAWSGVLQQALHPKIAPGEVREAKLGILPLAEGGYQVNATVEEIRGRRKTAAPAALDGGFAVSGERRLWHARRPCLIDAVDAPASIDR